MVLVSILPKHAATFYSPSVNLRFFIDHESGLPHIYNHAVSEDEVEQALANRGEDRPGSRDSRIAIGQTDKIFASNICA